LLIGRLFGLEVSLGALDHFGFFSWGPHPILLGLLSLLDLYVTAAVRDERLLRLILLLSPVLLLILGSITLRVILGSFIRCTTDDSVVLTNVRIDFGQKVGVGIEHKFTRL
jgi:hypothetical protein